MSNDLSLKDLKKVDPLKLSPEKRAEMLKQMEAMLDNEISTNRVAHFKPYPWQAKFIESAHKKMVVFAPSPNKIGKCCCYNTLIYTPNGEVTIGKLYEIGESFDVYAWDGEKNVISKALPPFKKDGLHECYRITMSDGSIIEAADHHKILTSIGEYISVADLAQSFSCHSQSNLELYQSIHVSNVLHLSEIQLSSLAYYLGYYYSCDGQLRSLPSSDPISFPSINDVLPHILPSCNLDGQANKYTNIHQSKFVHPSSSHDPSQIVNQLVESLFRISCRAMKLVSSLIQVFRQPSNAEVSESQLNPSISESNHSYIPPLYYSANHIISIKSIGKQVVYDFTVPKYHNYCAGGMVHHNTVVAICIAISWLKGYEPWFEVDKNFPDAVKVKNKYYRASSLKIKPPVDIVMCGEDWKEHIGKTLVPEFKNWIPAGEFSAPRKNEQGIENHWTHKNRSTLTFMCYTQDAKLFESSKIQGALEDEPPPQDKREGLKRGLFYDRGKEVITATPLSEAWLLDELVLKDDPDIGVMKGLTIYDNPDKYNNEKKALTKMGLSDSQIQHYFDILIYDDVVKKTCVKDQGQKAEKYVLSLIDDEKHTFLKELDILRFVKNTHPDKAPARFHGTFKALVGRILKDYERDMHVIESFKIPPDWPVTAMIDLHISTPQAIAFYAVDPTDRKYVIHEIFENISPSEIADEIIRQKKLNSWRLEYAEIDPLAKGDSAYVKNRLGDSAEDSFSIIFNKLLPEGIILTVSSKDKDSGIRNLQSWLRGPNKMASVFFFDTLRSANGAYGHLHEILRWVYDDDGKPKKETDHFMEIFYRYALKGVKYTKPLRLNLLNKSSGGKAGDWMGN